MGQRITVIGGSWPERIGCTGRIVTDDLPDGIYPRSGRRATEVILLLDDDPIGSWPGEEERGWTCVLDRSDVEVEP